MPSPARWWSNHACCDEVSETIVRCVDGRQSGDGATSIGDDHFFTGLHAIDVLAETILQIADPHLGPGSSYIHDSSVATQTIRSRIAWEAAAHPICQSLSDTTRFERTSSGWSHSKVTPTTSSPRPNANRISVAEGSTDTKTALSTHDQPGSHRRGPRGSSLAETRHDG